VRARASNVLKGWDFWVGLLGGGIAAVAATSRTVRDAGVTVLLGEAAIGIALLSVVLAGLAIITPTFDGLYRRVLEKAGGVRQALDPYLLIAAVSGIGAVVAVLGALTWPELGTSLRVLILGLATMLAVWAISGTVSLVELTIFHADQRAELLRGIDDAEELRVRRLAERRQGDRV
jgi:hypothetical protein